MLIEIAVTPHFNFQQSNIQLAIGCYDFKYSQFRTEKNEIALSSFDTDRFSILLGREIVTIIKGNSCIRKRNGMLAG